MRGEDPGLLVVNRLELMRRAERGGRLAQREPAVAMSIVDIFRRYRGFDGVAWPIKGHPPLRTEDGLAELTLLPAIERYARTAPESDIVLLARHRTHDRPIDIPGWRWLGFDVGFFESEWSHFSIVLNDVIWGTHDRLRAFGEKLNEHLLLSHIGDAEALVQRHLTLLREGKDVEQGEMEPFAVYVPST